MDSDELHGKGDPDTELWLRDKFRCAYCGETYPIDMKEINDFDEEVCPDCNGSLLGDIKGAFDPMQNFQDLYCDPMGNTISDADPGS